MISRLLRRAALSMFSASHRAALRRLYDVVTAPPVDQHVGVEVTPDGGLLTIAGGPSVRIPAECLADVQHHFATREAAAELVRFLAEADRPGCFFDVGANNGLFSVAYCLVHPANRSVAFEPSRPLVERIRQMAELNGVADRVEIVAKAVAEAPGERQLMLASLGGYVQVAAFEGTVQNEWQTLPVETTTLDLESARIQPPTVVKIDVEGFESEVIRGGARVIASDRPTIFLEVHLNYLEQRRISPVAVTGPIAASNYEFRDLAGRRRSEQSISKSWAPVLHVVGKPAGPRPSLP